MKGPGEDPWISLGASGNHQTITAGLIKHPFRILRCKNITISDHWDLHCLFYLADDIPVCFSRIKLGSGPSVDCNCRHAAAFRDPGNLHGIDIVIIKALAEFHSYWLFYLLYQSR